MAQFVDPAGEGVVIELGPGTGPVTLALLQRGIAPERLLLVEFDAKFCRLLERRFPRCRVVQGDAYNLEETLAGCLQAPAAAIVSSLPLLNKNEFERRELLEQAFGLMRPDGLFVQFTYGMVSPVPLRAADGARHNFDAEASPPVLLNLPPARVFAYRRPQADRTEDNRPDAKRPRAGEALIVKLKARRDRMRDDLRETTERVEYSIKLRRVMAKRGFQLATRRVRDEKTIKPALAMLKKFGESRKPRDR